jgi:hypothetical protein
LRWSWWLLNGGYGGSRQLVSCKTRDTHGCQFLHTRCLSIICLDMNKKHTAEHMRPALEHLACALFMRCHINKASRAGVEQTTTALVDVNIEHGYHVPPPAKIAAVARLTNHFASPAANNTSPLLPASYWLVQVCLTNQVPTSTARACI